MRSKFAFFFSEPAVFPPSIHNIKCYYVSMELAKRGNRVAWIQWGSEGTKSRAEDLEFITVPRIRRNLFTVYLAIFQMVLLSVAHRIQVAYVDEWLFFREKPIRRLTLILGLRLVGVKSVLDERDPFIDFEIASGWIQVGSKRLPSLRKRQSLLQRLVDLLILPSKAYADLLVAEGFPRERVLGIFRGIDTGLFRPIQDSSEMRRNLGIGDKFVIGWFGLMLSYRMIGEILVPLILDITKTMPEAHFVIGGEGPLRVEFERLEERGDLPLSLVGMVAYGELPKYISACDVLLCPVDDRFRFSKNSAWLKIPETLAVGKPIIASRTVIAQKDFMDLKGVIWVSANLDGFKDGLKEVHESYERYLSLAMEQADNIGRFSTGNTMSVVASRLEHLATGSAESPPAAP